MVQSAVRQLGVDRLVLRADRVYGCVVESRQLRGERHTVPVACTHEGIARVRLRTTDNEVITIHVKAYVSPVRIVSLLKLRHDISDTWLVSLSDTGSIATLELTNIHETNMRTHLIERNVGLVQVR